MANDNASRLLYVDPNPDGRELINPEDLSIMVQLTTVRKPKATISSDTGISVSSGNVGKICFIEGSPVGSNGETSLTTSYTDIGTTFAKPSDDNLEGLGITDIDIQFNTSYAPVVKIKFIDVRAGMMSRQSIDAGAHNKYAVFFDLPYPIFNLTVKGYYGKAVSYCLHMVKWNAKLNPDTGNFEIEAEFIGYTYAMLTDMLMGYLKAIPKTEIGANIFKKIKDEFASSGLSGATDSPVITIDEMIQQISVLNENIVKFKQTDPTYKKLLAINKANNIVVEMKKIISDFFVSVGVEQVQQLAGNGESWVAIAKKDTDTVDDLVQTYNDTIDEKIDELKKYVTSTNTTKELFHAIITTDLFKSDIVVTSSGQTTNPDVLKRFIEEGDYTEDEKNHVQNVTQNLAVRLPEINPEFTLYDLFRAIKEIDRILVANEELEGQAKLEIAAKLRNIAADGGGFNPTIRNITRILTVHCEVLLEAVRQVSIDAEKESNEVRRNALLKIGKENLNVKPDDTIYAFPEYDEDGEETWIGKRVTAYQMDEVKFVEDLLAALIKSKQVDLSTEALRLNTDLDWFALNPLDTKASQAGGIPVNPYRAELAKHPDDLLRVLMYRSFMFLGLGNLSMDDELLQYMAKFEANNLFFGIRDQELRDAIATNFEDGTSMTNHFLQGSANITNYRGNNEAIPYMINSTGSTDGYEYTYISSNGRAYIPVNGGWTGEEYYNGANLKLASQLRDVAAAGELFIGNYINGNSDAAKVDDGAVYLRIIDYKDYQDIKYNLPIELAADTVESYREKYEIGSRAKQSEIDKTVYESDSLIELLNPTEEVSEIKNLNPIDTRFGVTEFFKVQAGGNSSNDLSSISDDSGNAQVMPVFYIDNNDIDIDERIGTIMREKKENKDAESKELGANIPLVNRGLSAGSGKLAVDKIELAYTPISDNTSESLIRTQSLFGSVLYYAQEVAPEPQLAKGFLFLNTFPFTGIKGDDFQLDTLFGDSENSKTISGMFSTNAAFIECPTSWAYWVGSLLWREKYFNDNGVDPIITKAVSGNTNTPVNMIPTVSSYPAHDELWYSLSTIREEYKSTMFFAGPGVKNTFSYKKVDQTLLRMPEQVKNIFINLFMNWVTTGFENMKSRLEISVSDVTSHDATTADITEWIEEGEDNITAAQQQQFTNGNTDVEEGEAELLIPTNALINLDNYYSITPEYYRSGLGDIRLVSYKLPLKDDTVVNRMLSDLMIRRSVVLNYTPNTFRTYEEQNVLAPITMDKSMADTFFDVLAQEFSRLNEEFRKEIKDEQQVKNSIFQSSSNDIIKLNIYRHLSALNNKWVGDIDDTKSMFYTCQTSDLADTLAADRGGITRLIDSFIFVNKAYTDIGDEFLVNPKIVSDMITTNYNQSFFDLINRVLADNNFNFIPLPAYVNFKTPQGFNDVFEPFSYNEVVENGENYVSGPSFVCVYTGQLSKNLDLGNASEYVDDGVDLSPCGISRKDKQFTNPIDSKTGGLSLPVFEVNYAQQNQNYFKSVKLDQREFTETEESLVIIDDLSKSSDKNKSAYIGQNLFNIYQTRSYSAEVEALGMPLIQPMMYFQLNNIPMFRGAYLIIDTSHSIKPNHMTTTFKGVRIKDVRPPKVETVFEISDLLGELDGTEALKYNIDDKLYDDSVKKTDEEAGQPDPILEIDDSTVDYYNTGFKKSRSFTNAMFDKPSNTRRNGTALTYNEILEEVSEITKVPVLTLKVMSVMESTVGNNKIGNGQSTQTGNDGMNSSGFVGLMQFGYDATNQVKDRVENSIFGRGLEFFASVDETNNTLILPLEGNWKKSKLKTQNSMFDDYISAMAAAYFAIDNIDIAPSRIKNYTDVYLAHQQGRTGLARVKANPTEEINSPSTNNFASTSKNLVNNTPYIPDGVDFATDTEKGKYFFNWRNWYMGWLGVIESVATTIDPNTKVFTPNANNLRRVLNELGYTEKGDELSNNGDITEEMSDAAIAVFRTINSEYPNIGIRVTAGNDTYHSSSNSRHRYGRAIDFTISPENTSTQANIETILKGYAVGNNPDFRYINEYTVTTANSTGGHFHISWGNGTEGQSNLTAAINEAQGNSNFVSYTV